MKKTQRRNFIAIILLGILICSNTIRGKFNYDQMVKVSIILLCLIVVIQEIERYLKNLINVVKMKKAEAIEEKNEEAFIHQYAIHEAGHAIVSAALLPNIEIKEITIKGTKNSNGHVEYEDYEHTLTKEQFFCLIARAYGGCAAEEIIFNHVTTGSRDDFKRASKYALEMINEFGMGNNLLAKIGIPEFDYGLVKLNMEEVNSVSKKAYEKAKNTVYQNNEALVKLAKVLEEKNSLKKEEIKKFMMENNVFPEET